MSRLTGPIETYRGVAYPWHCDSMGHMNTQHYCGMFDTATFHFLGSLAGFRKMKAQGIGWADRKQTLTYDKEVLAGDLLIIRSATARIGRTSISFIHTMTDAESGEPRATSENVTVLFDLVNRAAIPLTPEIVQQAEVLMAP